MDVLYQSAALQTAFQIQPRLSQNLSLFGNGLNSVDVGHLYIMDESSPSGMSFFAGGDAVSTIRARRRRFPRTIPAAAIDAAIVDGAAITAHVCHKTGNP